MVSGVAGAATVTLTVNDANGVQVTTGGSTVVFSGATSAAAGYWEASFPPTVGSSLTVTMTAPNSAGSNWLSIWEAKPVGSLQ